MPTVHEIKDRIRQRDRYRCTSCGMTNDQHIDRFGCSLDVHRVTPGSDYSEQHGVCVTLCKSCHGPQPKRPAGTYPDGTSMVRLSEEDHAMLKELAKRNDRTLIAELRIALRNHLRETAD